MLVTVTVVVIVPFHDTSSLSTPAFGQRERRVARAVAERVQRRHRRVDVVALPVRPPAGELVAVVRGDLSRRTRIGDRQLAAGVGRTGQHVGDRRRPPPLRGARPSAPPRTARAARRCRSVVRRRARARPGSRCRAPPGRGPPAPRAGRATRRRGSRRSCSRRSARPCRPSPSRRRRSRRRASTASAKPVSVGLLTSQPWANRTPSPRRLGELVEHRRRASTSTASSECSSSIGMSNTLRPLRSSSCSDSTWTG